MLPVAEETRHKECQKVDILRAKAKKNEGTATGHNEVEPSTT